MRRITLALVGAVVILIVAYGAGVLSPAPASAPSSSCPAASQENSPCAPADGAGQTQQDANTPGAAAEPAGEEHPIFADFLELLAYVMLIAGGCWYVALSSKSD